jgi:hypothetical protein
MKKLLTIVFILIFNAGLFSQAPVVTSVSGSTAVCSSPGSASSYTIQASNLPTSYQWSVFPSNGVVINNPGSPSSAISFPHSTLAYTITVTASNSSGTSAPYQYTVMVYETPDVTFSGNTTFCQGSSTNIQASSTIYAASPTINYSWLPAAGLNTYSGPAVMASPTIPTTYTVTAVKGPCSNTATITITPISSPTIQVNVSNSVVCEGMPITLTANGANTYTWTGNVTNGIPFVPPFSNIYYVTGTGSNGCEAWSFASVTVTPAPSLTVSSNSASLCAGQNATLTINGTAQSYSLNNVSTPTVIVISPPSTTIYTVTGMGAGGCAATATLTQNVISCLGISEYKSSTPDFIIFPNPNNGVFTIRSSGKQEVKIYSQTGILLNTLLCEADQDLTVENLAAGIYFISGEGLNKKRIIILD